MARVTMTDEEVRQREADRDVVVHESTLVRLIRHVERGHDNFVFSHDELKLTFPDQRSSDVGPLARVLGEGWGVRHGMAHVLTFTGERRDGLKRLRGLLDGRD